MQAPGGEALRGRAFFWVGLAIYATVYLALLPGRVLVTGDDFAHLESIVGTLASGRLYTHDFLEPYSALLTATSSLLFWLTDDFYLSTYGPLGLCALLDFILLHRLFAGRLTPGFDAATCLALCTAPIYLGKSLEFVALVPFTSLLLGALLLHRTGRTAGFHLVTFLAFSLRQTGILLLALPVYDLCAELWRTRVVDRRRLAWISSTALACAAFSLYMNPTFAREVNGARLLAGLEPGRLFTNLELLLLFTLSFVSTWNLLLHPIRWPSYAPRSLAIRVLLSLMCVQLHLQRDEYLRIETPLAMPAWALENLDGILSLWFLASIWLMDYRRLRPHRLAFLMLCWIGALSLRETLWDYYLTGLFILSAVWVAGFAVTPRPPHRVAKLGLSLLLALNLHHALLLKEHLDRQELQIVELEQLLRAGRIDVTELGGAPYGFVGWKLCDRYLQHDAPRIARDLSIPAHWVLSGFGTYLGPERVALVFDASFPREGVEVLAEGRARVGFREVDWWLLRRSRERPAPAADRKPYPLTNREWSQLLGPGLPAADEREREEGAALPRAEPGPRAADTSDACRSLGAAGSVSAVCGTA